MIAFGQKTAVYEDMLASFCLDFCDGLQVQNVQNQKQSPQHSIPLLMSSSCKSSCRLSQCEIALDRRTGAREWRDEDTRRGVHAGEVSLRIFGMISAGTCSVETYL